MMVLYKLIQILCVYYAIKHASIGHFWLEKAAWPNAPSP